MAAPHTVDENQTYLPGWIPWKDFVGVAGGGWFWADWRNIKTFIANGWPAATVVTPLWSFKVDEQSYVSFPLGLGEGAKGLMILLASVAGALLFVNHSPAGQRPRTLSDAQPGGLAGAEIITITKRKYPHWLNRAWAVRAHRWRRVCLVLVGLFHGNDLGRLGTGADQN